MNMHPWLKQFPIQQFKKNTFLCHQGDPLEKCYYLVSGICAQLIDFANGTGITSRYYFSEDMLSIWGVFKGQQYYSGSVKCKTNVYATVIPCQFIRDKMDTSFDFYRWAAEKAMQNNLYVYELYQKKAKGNAVEILCYTIKALLQENREGNFILAKCFTIEELGQHLRLHRVTVSKIFKALCLEKILEKQSEGWLVTDLNRLSELASGDQLLHY